MTGQIINATWAAADIRMADRRIVGLYVNLRAAQGLVALRHGGTYTLAAVVAAPLGRALGHHLAEAVDGLEVVPLEGWKRSSRADIEHDLRKVVEVVKPPADEPA